MRRLARRPRIVVALTVAALLLPPVSATSAGDADRDPAPASGAASVGRTIAGERSGGARSGVRRVPVDRLPASTGAAAGPVRGVLPLPSFGDVADRRLAAVPPAPDAVTISGGIPAATENTPFSGMASIAGAEPPASSIAVGPEHVVHAVDARIRISSRAGATILTVDAADLFGLSQIDDYEFELFRPRVVYDSLQGRWLAIESSFDCYPTDDATIGTGYVDVAVSDTADPTGTWTARSVPYPDAVPADSGLGTSTDKVVVGSNVYDLVSGGGEHGCDIDPGQFLGSEIDVMAWSELRSAGDALVDFLVSGTDFPADYHAWQPALQTPATTATAFVVGQGAGGVVTFARITGSPAAGGLTEIKDVRNLSDLGVVAPFATPPDPFQPGSPATITDAVDGRATGAIWQNGRLAFVSTYPCDPAGGTVENRDCVRIGQLNTSPTTPTRHSDRLISQSTADLYTGGVGFALNGDLHATWTRSYASSGGFPSGFTAYFPAGAAVGTMSQPVAFAPGTGTYPGTRWGPGVSVAQDPQVVNAVWPLSAYSAGGSFWATKGAQLQTGGATYVPLTPVRVLDSRSGVGLTGSFASSSPRDFVVAGFSGGSGSVPAGAIAVTGNVTVTGQTAKGYVSITTTSTSNPRTSTVNFPLGDTRANNITIPLSAAGRLSAVFKGSSGSRAHIIFDVTGVFVPGTTEAAFTPRSPVRALDTRPDKNIGLPGVFRTGTPRKLIVAGPGGVSGIPADAVAITANLTVVGQTRSGVVSVTPTSQASPLTSTINFPTGDTRANGLTARLDGGALWLVYNASASATTHLILDITGYYRPSGAGLAFYPLDPGRIMDTRTNVLSGLSGRFTMGTPRRLDTDGHWGVPAGAKAVTGNLTVSSQTASGFVSATPTSVASPMTSSLNFPKSDVRANGLTVPLHTDGNQWFVYRAAGPATTHLILDVTGYFR